MVSRNGITRDVLMKSFYEPLFEPETIDFMMSYICLHWLDTTGIREGESAFNWKLLGAMNNEQTVNDSHLEWTHINETSTPKDTQEAWRTKLAHAHLAKFLALRSRELRPGAELLLVMVGHPHEFVTPADGGPGPLTRAMKRCIDRGDLRKEVLHQTTVPYFLRTVSDIKAALDAAKTVEIAGAKINPGSLLELVDCRSIPAITKGDGEDTLGGAFELFWIIHSHSIASANPSANELKCIRTETRQMFDEIYNPDVGIPSSFVACTLRRRTRERWCS